MQFKNLPNYQNLPYIFGKKEEFKILHENLFEIDFPIDLIKKYTLLESNRWDLETINNKLIKLPLKNYNKILKSLTKTLKNPSIPKKTSPYGNGDSARKIIQHLRKNL